MKRLENFGVRLTRNEMKNIGGGVVPAPCRCSCSGSTGTWSYNYEPNGATIAKDIKDYCSTNTANCSGCSDIYK